jgi:hypothetical protein
MPYKPTTERPLQCKHCTVAMTQTEDGTWIHAWNSKAECISLVSGARKGTFAAPRKHS